MDSSLVINSLNLSAFWLLVLLIHWMIQITASSNKGSRRTNSFYKFSKWLKKTTYESAFNYYFIYVFCLGTAVLTSITSMIFLFCEYLLLNQPELATLKLKQESLSWFMVFTSLSLPVYSSIFFIARNHFLNPSAKEISELKVPDIEDPEHILNNTNFSISDKDIKSLRRISDNQKQSSSKNSMRSYES